MGLIEVQDLSLAQRLVDISFEIRPNELVGIVGPNGAGKSSLLESLASLQPYSGRVQFEQSALPALPPRERARRIAFLPQQSTSAWTLSVRDLISLGRLPWGDSSERIIRDAAHSTGVQEWLDLPVSQLSGGEQARVWIARLLAGEPRVILADEPLASLDLYYQQQILGLLRNYATQARSVVLSLHDLSLAAGWCDRVLLLDAGRLVAIDQPEKVLTPDNLREVFRVNAEIDFSSEIPRLHLEKGLPH